MIKTITITVTLILIFGIVNAQKLKPNAIIKTDGQSFKTESTAYGTMTVKNDKSPFKNKVPQNQRYQLSDPRTINIQKAFDKVFPESRLRQLLNEPAIMLTYYISPGGHVMDVSYDLKTNTLITGNELESLTKAVKEYVSFKITEEGPKNGDFFMIAQRISFKRILEKTQP